MIFIIENLALKYRPRKFSDLQGQDVSRFLLGSMLKQFYLGNIKLPAGLLFVGARGEGKTTAGRIVAASLNCSNRVNIEPCGECSVCNDVLTGSGGLVKEIDAASHGSVEDMRVLKSQLYYQFPGLYRVVIIDEIHGLSKAAFDNMLKVLEEPPEKTLFVFATTEVEKIPATIISRCLVYTFNKITPNDIFNRLKFICDQEKFSVEDYILHDIAGSVDGAMRDAVMKLNQVIMVSDINYEKFKVMFGVVDKRLYNRFLVGLVQRKPMDLIKVIDEFYSAHTNGKKFVEGLLEYLILLFRAYSGQQVDVENISGLGIDELQKALFTVWAMYKDFGADVSKHRMILELLVLKLLYLFGVSQKDMENQQIKPVKLSDVFGK